MQIKSWREGAAIKLRPGRRFVMLETRDGSISTESQNDMNDTVKLILAWNASMLQPFLNKQFHCLMCKYVNISRLSASL